MMSSNRGWSSLVKDGRVAAAAMTIVLGTAFGCGSSSPPEPVASEHRASALNGAINVESLGSPPGITLIGTVAATSWGPNRFDLFARGSDNHIWHRWFDGTWHAWEDVLPGTYAAAPAAVAWGPGRIDLAAIDNTTKRMVHLWYGGWWQSEFRGGSQTLLNVQPAITTFGVNTLNIFARDTAGTIKTFSFDSAWNETWQTVTGPTGVSDLSAISDAPGRIHVFGADAQAHMDHRYTLNSGASWVSDPRTNIALQSQYTNVAVASPSNGLLDFFFPGPNGHIMRNWFELDWSPNIFDTGLAGWPSAVSWDSGRLDLFYLDAGAQVQHTRYVIGGDVLTQHNDANRRGWQGAERELNVSNVNATHFGLLQRIPVDADIYAQPLFVGNVNLSQPGGARNLIYVATENNTVTCFDADSYTPIWGPVSLGFGVPIPQFEIGRKGCVGSNVNKTGITSTPVIDTATSTLYVETFNAVNASGTAVSLPACTLSGGCCTGPVSPSHTYQHKLWALNSLTGAVKQSRVISGSYGGLNFDPPAQLQRPALLQAAGKIYVAFGAYVDQFPYAGWVFGYNAGDLSATPSIYATQSAAAAHGAGIWQSGQGPVFDGSRVFVMTGNGTFDNSANWADTVLGLSTSLARVDSFTPMDQDFLGNDNADLDLGSAGPVLLDSTRLMGGGKEGVFYIMNRTNLGGYHTTDNVIQAFKATLTNNSACYIGNYSNIHGSPVIWPNPQGRLMAYVWGEQDRLHGFDVTAGTTVPTVASTGMSPPGSCPGNVCPCWGRYRCANPANTLSSTELAPCGMPGGALSISSSDSQSGTGIIWAAIALQDATASTAPGRLYAFNAETLGVLWHSDMQGSPTYRDQLGNFGKFVPPTVAASKVFVATQSNQLDVYGILPGSRYAPL